ncbi:MAG TPA: dienelactone hydrolase family protein [Planctomycetota bacterium]|nr:dienelactone hydrolase family protein [Planctomycetota bacterium]
MIGDVILPSTTKADWPEIRREIRSRITASMGTEPEGLGETPPQHEVVERCEKDGLTHIRLRYHVLDDDWTEAVLILPEGGEKACPAPAVLAIHGTDYERGKLGVIDPGRPRRNYGGELARRGFVTFSADQFPFGTTYHDRPQREYVDAFFEKYPDWSLDGRRLWDHKRALDVLETLPFVEKTFGAIGNSLGGRSVMYLAALDERIAAAVSSTGISPNATNVFRSCTIQTELSPALSRAIAKNGKIPWEYHEMIALCAPRALLALEPYNDSENPDVFPTFECVYRASSVYRLLGVPERLTMVCHGEGHDTPDDLREFACRWLDRFLKQDAGAGRVQG